MEAASSMTDESPRAKFSRLAREHHRMLLVYARTLVRDEGDARELVQEALLAAWKNMARFKVDRPGGPWLRGIVRNKWRDYCRKRGRRPEFSEQDLSELEGTLVTFDQTTPRPTLFDALQECREKLPETHAEAIAAVYDQGLSGEEAAARLEIRPATLRKRLERARAALHDCLQNSH